MNQFKKASENSESFCSWIGMRPSWVISAANFVIIFAFIVGYLSKNITLAYSEVGFGTYYSGAHLLLIAICCLHISRHAARAESPERRREASIWKFAAIGFFYLFFDEIAQIHEKIDFTIHYLFIETKSNLTDGIDDLILLSYIVFGGIFLLYNRATFLRNIGYKKTYLAAFLLVLLMAALDIYGNVLAGSPAIERKSSDVARMNEMVAFLEDTVKLWGGALILIAVSGTFAQYRQPHPQSGSREAHAEV